MRGTVLGYDPATGEGMLRGDDGQRYRFRWSTAWKGPREPRPQEVVDFEAAQGEAFDIFPERGGGGRPGLFHAAGGGRGSGGGLRFGPTLIAAIILLLAALFPLVRFSGEIPDGAGPLEGEQVGAGYSVAAISTLVDWFDESIRLGEIVAKDSDDFDDMDDEDKPDFFMMKLSVWVWWLLYLCPALAVLVIATRDTRDANLRWRLMAGIAAIALPFVVPQLSQFFLWQSLGEATQKQIDAGPFDLWDKTIKEIEDQTDVDLDDLIQLGLGFWMHLVAGAALLASAAGAFSQFEES